MEIIQPQRYAFWSEQIVIATLKATCNSRVKACRVIQQVECRCIGRVNIYTQGMEAFEIRLPRRIQKPIKSDVPISLHVGAPAFHQTFQDPAQGEFETRLKREQATKFIGRSPLAEPFYEV